MGCERRQKLSELCSSPVLCRLLAAALQDEVDALRLGGSFLLTPVAVLALRPPAALAPGTTAALRSACKCQVSAQAKASRRSSMSIRCNNQMPTLVVALHALVHGTNDQPTLMLFFHMNTSQCP